MYPIVFENLYGEKEHVFSIIYVYDEELFLKEMEPYTSSIIIKIILEILFFLIFGCSLLYILYLTFYYLTQYIVIPIKNVNYMLKGINIGGNKRLDFLDHLQEKQNENIEKLNKFFSDDNQIIKKNLEINSEIYNFEKNNLIDKFDSKETKNTYIKQFVELNKNYDQESEYISKEINFDNFDEELLKYRPIEINNLVKILTDLKSALAFTSRDR